MRKINLFTAMLAFVFVQNVSAQDFNDTNIATHVLEVTVPEVAILDIWDSNTTLEAATILFDMANVTIVNTNAEAGLYAFEDMSYTGLWLNYTSVVGLAGSGLDVTRQIHVQFESGSTFPGNLDLRITPQAPLLVIDGGTVASAGDITPGGVALGVTTPIGQDALLVDSIESVYTGDETQGVELAYTLEQNGNFAGYLANAYSATLRYTLSDF
jgi:hypothetical protein